FTTAATTETYTLSLHDALPILRSLLLCTVGLLVWGRRDDRDVVGVDLEVYGHARRRRLGLVRRLGRCSEHERRVDPVHGDEKIAAVAAKLAADDSAGDRRRRRGESEVLRADARDRAAALRERRAEAAERARARQRGDVAEEPGGEQRLRPAIELLRRAGLHEAAAVEEHDAVGDSQCLVRVVRDDHGRRAARANELEGSAAHVVAQPAV